MHMSTTSTTQLKRSQRVLAEIEASIKIHEAALEEARAFLAEAKSPRLIEALRIECRAIRSELAYDRDELRSQRVVARKEAVR
jgi:hypothetical protein